MKPDNVTGSPLNPQNWNLYSYVRGNPANFNDPTGHACKIGEPSDSGDSWTTNPSSEINRRKKKSDFYQRTRTIIPGALDAEHGGGSYPTIMPAVVNVHVNVYIDKYITGKEREEALEDFNSNVMAGVFAAFGPIGIFIDFSFKGEIGVSLNNQNLPASVRGDGITSDGSLNVVITDFNGARGAFAMGENHTGFIFLNRHISSYIAREEFLHAFGICRNPILDVTLRLPHYFNLALYVPLTYYTSPLLITAMAIMREEASRYDR